MTCKKIIYLYHSKKDFYVRNNRNKKTHIGRFNIIQDKISKNDEVHPYSYIEFTDGVCVIPFIDEKHILILREYRHAIKKWVYNFPGGMINDHETPEDAARRELTEETGYDCDELIDLGYTYPSFGSTTEKIYLFSTFIGRKKLNKCDALESIEEVIVSVDELEEMIINSTFVQGAGQVAWLRWRMMNCKTNY